MSAADRLKKLINQRIVQGRMSIQSLTGSHRRLVVRYTIPYISQFGDPALQHPAWRQVTNDDRRWLSSGARDVADYKLWAPHICGITCLAMALADRGVGQPIIPLAKRGLNYGAYVMADGHIGDAGLNYRGFIRLLKREFGWSGHIYRWMTIADIGHQLAGGSYVMASVHPDISSGQPAPARGGHLVLITGFDGPGRTITFNDPGGSPTQRPGATLSWDQFESYFGHRGVSFGPLHDD